MDLPALRAVVAVADTLHFGQAARRLDIAQPQVSQRVQRLERQLGLSLFDRDHHRVALTAAGAELIQHARETVAAADRLASSAKQLATGTSGVVRVGCVGSALFGPLTHVLADCRKHLPDVELRVREMESPEQVVALRSGDIDIGFLRPPGPPDLDLRVVWSEPLVLAVPVDDPLAGADVVDVARLAGRRVIAFPRERGTGYWDQIVAAVAPADVTIEEVESAEHITTLLGMVALSAGITLVPASMGELSIPGVTYRSLHPSVELRLSVATATGRPSASTARVLEHIAIRS
jgi:DNA-binding transcriptional LysR family regulator